MEEVRIVGFSFYSTTLERRLRYCNGCLGRHGQKMTRQHGCRDGSGRPIHANDLEARAEVCCECGGRIAPLVTATAPESFVKRMLKRVRRR